MQFTLSCVLAPDGAATLLGTDGVRTTLSRRLYSLTVQSVSTPPPALPIFMLPSEAKASSLTAVPGSGSRPRFPGVPRIWFPGFGGHPGCPQRNRSALTRWSKFRLTQT